MFKKIVHASDGSEPAFNALKMAVELAKREQAELHMVCVEELPNVPDYIEDVRLATETADARFKAVLSRARKIAEEAGVALETHVLVGHPARDVVNFAENAKADLLVIGATGHTAIYERLIGSRADRIVQLARCPVLVVK
jgi:nucleotide-binding universal stress UspA family protein